MKRFGLNSGYIGVDRRRDEAGIAPLQKTYLERIRGGNYLPPFLDPDAFAFITAAGITDLTISDAINTLVIDLKEYGIWTKMKAIYPFVGGTATTHKYNLKDPRDLDAAFRLTFFGGWTHSANGAQPNGTNGYADTFYNPRNQNTQFNVHVSNYSRTQNSLSDGVQLGAFDADSNSISLFQYYNIISIKGSVIYFYPNTAVLANNTNTLGFQIATRTTNNNAKLYFNGSLLNTSTNTETGNTPNRSFYLGASNWSDGPNQYSPHQHAFDSIGDGLTDTEASNFYTAVQTFQTALGRNV